ncbi:DUF4926 domain-containing protein [Fibrella arboris]|uniref:DUF4926 domain-containing protein n=1 Tax=Fibrella arboris TaxID=3242486 RepID=UPI003522AC41
MTLIDETDLVALLIDLPGANLVRGDVGTIAMIHGDQQAFDVEFVNAVGKTIALKHSTEPNKKIDQAMAILHVPELQLAA